MESINNITPFYTGALNIWYNPYLINTNGEVLEPVKSRGDILNCNVNMIDSILNRPFINCKRVVQNIQYKKAEENSNALKQSKLLE